MYLPALRKGGCLPPMQLLQQMACATHRVPVQSLFDDKTVRFIFYLCGIFWVGRCSLILFCQRDGVSTWLSSPGGQEEVHGTSHSPLCAREGPHVDCPHPHSGCGSKPQSSNQAQRRQFSQECPTSCTHRDLPGAEPPGWDLFHAVQSAEAPQRCLPWDVACEPTSPAGQPL